MNQNLGTHGRQPVRGLLALAGKRLMTIAVLTLVASAIGMGQGSDLQQKLAAAKQSVAENQQKLHQYGPDGHVQKTAIGPPPQQPSGGRMKQRAR